jgi:hypothetical protein
VTHQPAISFSISFQRHLHGGVVITPDVRYKNHPMSASPAWALVAASFLLLGLFGYASVTRSKAGMIVGAVISALVLNGIASQIFTAVEIRTIKDFGTIQEDQIFPDMPNLMAGLIMFGWVFFFGGFFAGRLVKRTKTKTESEQFAAGNRP